MRLLSFCRSSFAISRVGPRAKKKEIERFFPCRASNALVVLYTYRATFEKGQWDFRSFVRARFESFRNIFDGDAFVAFSDQD